MSRLWDHLVARGRPALFAGCVAVAAAHGALAQDAVWDPEEVARLAEASARLADLLSRLVEVSDRMNALSGTLGRYGTLGQLDFTRFGLAEALQGAGPELGGLAAALGTGDGRIGSPQDTAAFVHRLTAAAGGPGQATRAAALMQGLGLLHRRAVEDGYALALHTRDSLTTAPARGAMLADQASTSRTLRGDVAADTAAGLAVVEQLASVKAMLAAIVEIEASRLLGRAGVSNADAHSLPAGAGP